MAKKADLLEKAAALGLNVTDKNTIAEIETAIASSETEKDASSTAEQSDTAAEATTKAGKRSKKGVAEAEEKAVKEARKRGEGDAESDDAAHEQKRGPVPVTRTLLERRSKKYKIAIQKIDKSKTYELAQALDLACQTSTTTFDASVELHVRLGVDPKQADQNIRDIVVLPSGTGKTLRVAVFAPSDMHAAATKAGADLVGDKEILDLLTKEDIQFDVLIATPQVMSQLGRFAKLLGPKGLMPNPKSGTVTTNIPDAVTAAKAGRVEFRVDKQGIVHVAVGKVSFGPEKLLINAEAVMQAIKQAKPASIKGSYILTSFVTTTMGPSIRIQ